MAVAAPLSATIIGFDDLDGSGNQAIPNGYAGLNWNNFYTYDATNDPAHLSPSGYDFSVISPNNVAFNGGANPVTVSSNTIFNLNSVYLHSVWRDGLQVQVIGFRAGVPVPGDGQTFTLNASATTPSLITLDYVGVDSVQFIPSGGTQYGPASTGTTL